MSPTTSIIFVWKILITAGNQYRFRSEGCSSGQIFRRSWLWPFQFLRYRIMENYTICIKKKIQHRGVNDSAKFDSVWCQWHCGAWLSSVNDTTEILAHANTDSPIPVSGVSPYRIFATTSIFESSLGYEKGWSRWVRIMNTTRVKNLVTLSLKIHANKNRADLTLQNFRDKRFIIFLEQTSVYCYNQEISIKTADTQWKLLRYQQHNCLQR